MKIKTNKYTRRLTYTRNTLPKVKIKKIEHDRAQTDMNITKIGKGYKLNSTSMMKQKTDMNITKRMSSTLTRIQLHFGEPSNKRIQIKQASKLPTKKVTENIQSTSNKIHYLYP